MSKSRSPLPLDVFDRTRMPPELAQRLECDYKEAHRKAPPTKAQKRSRIAAEEDRRQRIQWLALAAEALLEGQPVPREAALFLASALQSYLEQGGALEAYLRCSAPRGSHLTPDKLAGAIHRR